MYNGNDFGLRDLVLIAVDLIDFTSKNFQFDSKFFYLLRTLVEDRIRLRGLFAFYVQWSRVSSFKLFAVKSIV